MSFFFGKLACVSVIYATCYALENGDETSLSPRMDPSYMPAEEASLTHLNFTKEFDLDSVRIEFPPPVKGEDYKVESLGYKDGTFMFGYLGDLISLLSTDKFPLETLREVLSGNGKKGVWDLMKECLENEPGLIALASIAIILSVLIPVIFLSVCCCRLGGKCGAKKGKVKSKCCLTFAKTTWETLMVLFLLISCVGIILAFVTNMQMRGAVQDAEAVVSAGVADAGAFVRNTALQIRVTTETATDKMLEHVFRDLDAIRTILGRPIQHELASETKFQAAVKDLRDLDTDLSRLVTDCGTLLASAQNARLQAASADSALADLTRQVENAIRRCGEADKKFCSKVDYSGYRVSVSFSTYALEEVVSTLRTMVKKEEVSGLATKMQTEFADIPSHIHRTTATLRSNIKSMLRDYRTSLVESTREFDNLFADIQSRMFKFGTHGGALFSEARRYDDVRFFVGLGVSICLLFVWISLLLSVCCGCWKGGKSPLENGCAGRFGGGCLLMSVFFIAALSCPLWLAVSGLLIVGSHGQGLVCQTLYEQGFGTLARIVDGPNNDFGPGGFIGSVIFKNDSFKVPVEDVLRKCQREKSAFGVFHLDHYVDLQNLSRVRERTNVEKELETYRLDLSDAITFRPEVEVALKNNISALQIELTTFRLELQRQVMPSNPSLLVDQLEVASREVRSQATSSQLSSLAARARDIVNNQVRQLEIKKEDLQETPTRLIAEASLILKTSNATFEHLRKIQYFLKNHAGAVFNHKVRAYSRRIIGYLVQFTSYMTQALESEVANCKPVWNIFNQTRIVLCRYIVDPLNGFWFSTSCCLLVFFLSSVVGIKLAKYYRNGYENGDENGFHRSTWTIVGGNGGSGNNW